MEVSPGKPALARLYFLDWLRVLAFGLLVFYHAGLMFVDWGFHIQNDTFSEYLKIPLIFLNQWRLPLLFLVSGIGVRFAFGSRTKTVFLGERFTRLVIPFVVGILIVIPPQVYIERLFNHEFAGSYLQFYPEFFKGVYPVGNFTWNHLWFLAYLIVFVLITLPLFDMLRKQNAMVNYLVSSLFKYKSGWLIFVLPLVIVELTLRERWPDTRTLVGDWYNFAFYLLMFVYGYVFAFSKTLWDEVEKHTLTYLLVGVVSFLIIYTGWHLPGKNFLDGSFTGYIVFSVFKCLNVVAWILCFLGFSRKFLSKNSALLEYTNKAVYPFYILHQTVLIILGYFVLQWDLSIASKYALLVLGTFVVTLILYDLIILRVKFVGFVFGVKQR
jgi:hypothetical protein